MNRKLLILIFVFCSLFIFSCQKEDSVAPLNANTTAVTKGKNRFTIKIDGDEREYYVHVPQSYTGTSAVPVVFMLHGTSQGGEYFYNISGWREVGEDENIITVYPSSWRYCIIEGGYNRIQPNGIRHQMQPGPFVQGKNQEMI